MLKPTPPPLITCPYIASPVYGHVEGRRARNLLSLSTYPIRTLQLSGCEAHPRSQTVLSTSTQLKQVTVQTPSEDLPAGGAGGAGAEGGAPQSTNYTLFALPKSEKGRARLCSVSVADNCCL